MTSENKGFGSGDCPLCRHVKCLTR